MKIISTLCTFLCFLMGAKAQSIYDLRFSTPQLSGNGNTICSKLQIRAAEGQPPFSIAAHTIAFTFNPAAIANPTYDSWSFNAQTICTLPTGEPIEGLYAQPTFTYQGNLANITCLMNNPTFDCQPIDYAWTTLGQICFSLVDALSPLSLQFNSQYTVINLTSNQPAHFPGTWHDISAPFADFIDTDGDQLSDYTEFLAQTNPYLADSDGDLVPDGIEFAYGDTDNDNIINPLDDDDDNDGLLTIDEDTNQNNNPTDDDQNQNQIPDYLDPLVNPTTAPSIRQKIVLYPNPTHDYLFFTSLDNNLLPFDVVRFVVSDMRGHCAKKIHYTQPLPASFSLPIAELHAGIYCVSINDSYRFKFIKK